MITSGALRTSFALSLALAGLGLSPHAVGSNPFEDSDEGGKPAAPAKSAPTSTAAAKPAGPAPYLPSKEFQAFMKGFEGAWKCETQFAAGTLWPGSQPVASKTEVTIRRQFDGFMWHGEFKLAESAATPAMTGVFQIGYAAPYKQATYLSYDSVGSSMMGVGAIQGSQVTFVEEGFVKGQKVKVRETLAKQGPRKLYHKVEMDQGKGFQPLSEDTCSK